MQERQIKDFYQLLDMMTRGWHVRHKQDTLAYWLVHSKYLQQPNVAAHIIQRMLEDKTAEEVTEIQGELVIMLSRGGQELYKELLNNHLQRFYEEDTEA